MNPPSTPTQNMAMLQRPDEYVPMRLPGRDTTALGSRNSCDPNWCNNPNPAQERLEDHFKAEKEGKSMVTRPRPDEFVPMRLPGSETPALRRRNSCGDPNWCNNPNPAPESLEDHFKAEKEGNYIKADTAAPATSVVQKVATNTSMSIMLMRPGDFLPLGSPASPKRKPWRATKETAVVLPSPTRSKWRPDDFLPMVRPASHVRKSRQVAKEMAVVGIDDSTGKIDELFLPSSLPLAGNLPLPPATNTSTPIILMRPDGILPLKSPAASPKRKSHQVAKETAVVNTDENHAETKEGVETTVARSIATDLDNSATKSTQSNKLDDFRPLRRPSNSASSASRSNDSRPQTEKASKEHTSLPVEVKIDSFGTEANNCVGIDDDTIEVDEEVEQTIRDKAVCAEVLEKQNPAVKLRSLMNSIGHSNGKSEKPVWALELRLKQTGKAHFLKSEGNLAKPVTFSVSKGDGVNKEAQPRAVLKNKGVATTEKSIEWEKPEWAKCRELKATGKADVLISEGNLARPISLPLGSNNDAGMYRNQNEHSMRDWLDQCRLKED